MEVAVRENSMKTIGISITWLIQDAHCLEVPVLVSKFSLEDVRDFSLRLWRDADGGSAVLLGCRTIDEVSVGKLGLEWRIGQDVARGCLAYFRESKDSDGFVEKGEEGYVSRLYSLEEVLRLLLR
jgi:hypothetical protein